MKTLVAGLVAAFPCIVCAAEQPAPVFPDAKIGVPPLSLSETAKQGSLPLVFEAAKSLPGRNPLASPSRKFVSAMPIVPPRTDVDLKIRIKRPDPSVDYKMIVRTPTIESAK